MSRSKKAIKKLDFENLEVKPVRIRNKWRKQAVARVQTQSEDEHDSSSDVQDNNSTSSQQEEKTKDNYSSPVLFRKCPSRRCPQTPPLLSSRECSLSKRFKTDEEPQPSTSGMRNTSLLTHSPVLTFKGTSTQKTQRHSPKTNKQSLAIEMDDDSNSEECNIEDCSPVVSQKLVKARKTLRFSSGSRVRSHIKTITGQSQAPSHIQDELFVTKPGTENNEQDSANDIKVPKKNKGGLAARLVKLKSKQISDRRIHEHNMKLMRKEDIWKRKFYVVQAWKDAKFLTLKCIQIAVSEDGSITTVSPTDDFYVILKQEHKKFFRTIGQGTFFRIAAPWQEISLPAMNATVILAVTFIEVIETNQKVEILRYVRERKPMTGTKEEKLSLIMGSFFDTNESNLLP